MTYVDPIGAHTDAGIPMQGQEWAEQEFIGDDLTGVVFQDCRFTKIHFRETDFTQSVFVECKFEDCLIEQCEIDQTFFVKCSGTGLRFKGTEWAPTLVFTQCTLGEVTMELRTEFGAFSECQVDRLSFDGVGTEQFGLTISGSDMGALNLENARWKQCSVVEMDLENWNRKNAQFDSCSFVKVKALNLDLSDVRFEKCNLYASELDGVRLQNAEGCIFAECEMRLAECAGAKMKGALFSKIKGDEARFDQAELDGAMFPKASLVGAQFQSIHAHMSVWKEANLESANLNNADFFQSVFRNANLKDASVQNASFRECDLQGVEEPLSEADLTGARESLPWRRDAEKSAREEPTAEDAEGEKMAGGETGETA